MRERRSAIPSTARRTGRVALVLVALAAIGLAAAPAAAGGGTVGEPQPELAPFHVARSGADGSGAVLANRDLAIATPSTSGTTIAVCVLHPGGRICAHTATLHAFKNAGGQDTFSGTVEVIPTGGSAFSVVALDCCNIGSNGAVLFNTTDDGATFAPLVRAGDIATIGTATYAGGNIVVGSFEQGGLQVQAFSPHPSSPELSYAVPVGGADGNTSLTTFHGGVLVASDDTTNTHVEYAAAGSGLNTSGSYTKVGTFAHELVVAVSGDALLTDPRGSLTGGDRLRFFNGTSFGPARKVPDSRLGDDGYFAMQQAGGTVHVFFISRRTGYAVFEETTTDGVVWSPLRPYASAIGATSLQPVLGTLGAGLLDETAGTPVNAQPILNLQGVRVAFATPRVHVGHAAVLKGTAAPRLANQAVTLQELRAGKWYAVKSTRETATGTFAFSVAGATATYRAVVADWPGYYEFGYSNAATLTAVP